VVIEFSSCCATTLALSRPSGLTIARQANKHADFWVFGLDKLTTTSIIPVASPLLIRKA